MLKKAVMIGLAVALVMSALPAFAGQTVQKNTQAREGRVQAARLVVQRTAIRTDGSQVMELRFEGSGVAALGTWIDFPVLAPVKAKDVAVQSGLEGRYSVLSRVEPFNGHVQVRIAAIEMQLPFQGIPSGSVVATVVLPPQVDMASARVIGEKTSAADFQARDHSLAVFLTEDDGPTAPDLVAEAAAYRTKAAPTVKGTTGAPGIDFEIVDPTDGDNGFCVTAGGTFTADVVMRPGNDTATTCSQSCGTVDGGSGRLATAVLDIAFDTSKLGLASATKVDYVDGLVQDNSGSGRIGWAAAGDWSPDGDTTGTLATPCVMAKITGEITPMQLTFNVDPSFTAGSTTLHFRRAADGFAFSAADACANGFDESSGFDEIVDGVVGIDVTLDNAASSLAASATTIPITTGTSNLTASLSDGSNPLPGQVVRVELIGPNYSGATLAGVTDNADGTYSDMLTAGANPGRVKVRYYVDKCSGTWQDDASEDKVIIINNPAWGCDAGDANGDGGALTAGDATAIMLEWLDGDTNNDPTSWQGAGSYAATPCADANGDGMLTSGDATAVMLMWLAGMG